jgi:hypothetical protein
MAKQYQTAIATRGAQRMKRNTKSRRFSPAQLAFIIGGSLWLIAFLYFWLGLGMSIGNIFDLTVIGVSLGLGAAIGFFGFLSAFAAISAYRQQADFTHKDK